MTARCWPRRAGRTGGAPRRRRCRHRARPSVLRRVGRGGGRGRPRPGAGAAPGHLPPGVAPGQRLRRARHGAGARAPPGPGRPRDGSGVVHRRLGSRAQADRARYGRHPRLHGRRIAARPGGRPRRDRAHPAGRRPAERLPRSRRGREGTVGRPLRRGGDRPSVRVGRRLRRRRPALRRGPRAPRHDDQHRGPGEPVGPEAHCARVRVAGLDDRRRAGRRPRGGPRRQQRQRPGRRVAPHRAGLLRSDRRPCSTPTRRTTGSWCRSSPGAAPSPDVDPIDPIALPGVESVERQGAPPRSGSAGGDGSVRARIAALGAPPALLSGVPASDPGGAPRRARPTATPCAWWPPAVSTTPGARSPDRPRSPRWCRRWWRGPTRTTWTGWAPRRAIGSGCGRHRGELVLPAEADGGVPRGAVAIDFNVPVGPGTPGNAVATLIDSRNPVTDVRLESV